MQNETMLPLPGGGLERWQQRLWPLVSLLMLVSLYMAFVYAPTEASMGDIQRIFYFHVASAFISFIAFFVVAGYSIAFLRTRKYWYDRIAYASAELGIVFASINLITGSIWARPIWNTWWSWDARLTTMLILWFIYVAYLLLRDYAGENEKAARFAAVYAIVGTVDIPIVYFSIRWWRTIHPKPVMMGGEKSGLHPDMQLTLTLCFITLLATYLLLMITRLRLERARMLLEQLRQRDVPSAA